MKSKGVCFRSGVAAWLLALTGAPQSVQAWSTSGLWHQVPDGSAPLRPYASPTSTVWWYGLDATGTYDTGAANSGDLMTPPLVITPGQQLAFWSWDEAESTVINPATPEFDHRTALLSTDGGGSWAALGGFVRETPPAWRRQQVDLGAYAGQTVLFRFNFNATDNIFNSLGGWYLDDLVVETVTLRSWIDVLPPGVVSGGLVTVRMSVSNAGTADITGIVPTLTTTGNVYASSALQTTLLSGPTPGSIATLGPGAVDAFEWTFSVTGWGCVHWTGSATGTDSGTSVTAPSNVSRAVGSVGDPYEPGDNAPVDGSVLVPTGGTQTHGPHTVDECDPGDWFRIDMIQGAMYRFDDFGLPGGGSGIYNVAELYADAAGTVLVASAKSEFSGDGHFVLEYIAASTQTYYLKLLRLNYPYGLNYRVMPAGRLAASLAVIPDPAAPGTWGRVVFTVSNTGLGSADAVTPTLSAGTGADYVGGPSPAVPVTIAAGGLQSFTWTYSAAGQGFVPFSASATGTDTATGLALSAAASTVWIVSSLRVALNASPNPVLAGQAVTVVLTVTNGGGADVAGILPALQINRGGGLVSYASGPNPSGPASLVPGAGASFTWVYNVIAAGSVSFTATAAGTDAGSGASASAADTRVLAAAFASCPPPTGPVTAYAGTGVQGYNGDGIPAVSAQLTGPGHIAVDASGNLYIGDGNRVRKVDVLTGEISTVGGTGVGGYNGEGIPATSALLYSPNGVALDAQGNLYIADEFNRKVRRVDVATGLISLVAGAGWGYNGDGIAATAAWLDNPDDVAVDGAGNVYIADTGNARIRKVDASTGIISTIAGTGTAGYSGDGGPATAAQLSSIRGLTTDGAGNVYVADNYPNHRVRKVDAATGLISTVAGTGVAGYNGDGIAATAARLYYPQDVAVDASGNVYIADPWNNRIRRVDAVTGLISTVISGLSTFVPGVAVDGSCRIYAGDLGSHLVKRRGPPGLAAALAIVPASPEIGSWFAVTLTVTNDGAGTVDGILPGLQQTSGGTKVEFQSGPDPAGPVALAPGASATFTWTWSASGTTSAAFVGSAVGTNVATGEADMTAATASVFTILPAQLEAILTVSPAIPSTGQWFTVSLTISNTGSVSATGVVPSLGVMAGAAYLVPESGPSPTGPVTILPGARVAFAWTYSASGAGGVRFTASGSGFDGQSGRMVESGAVTADVFLNPLRGSLIVAPFPATVGSLIEAVLSVTNFGTGDVTGIIPSLQVNAGAVIPGSGPVPAGPVTLGPGAVQSFTWTFSVVGAGWINLTASATGTEAATGSVVVAASTFALAPGSYPSCGPGFGTLGTIAGVGGTGAFGGDGGPATAAQLYNPSDVAAGVAGDLYIADFFNHRVRKVDLVSGIITTIAGTFTSGYNGDGIAASTARLAFPSGVAVDGAGHVFIADQGNSRIRRVDAATGLISTVAGTGVAGYNGDGLAATAADLNRASDVTVDGSGNLFIADRYNHRVRRVDAASGLITTVAGTGVSGYGYDGNPATSSPLVYPYAVAVGPGGDLFLIDNTHRVRKVSALTGLNVTVAGTGVGGYNGDGIPATSAKLSNPAGLALDGGGDLLIGDAWNNRVRRVDALTGSISTVAGSGVGAYNGDGLPAPFAQLWNPSGVAMDAGCRLYIADTYNQRIRVVDRPALTGSLDVFPPNPPFGTWVTVSFTVTNAGAVTVTGVFPALDVNTGASWLAASGGPAPAGPLDLAPGSATVFRWTYSVSGYGTMRFTATATGTAGGPVYAVATIAAVSSGLSLPEAVDNLALTIPTGGDAEWFGQTVVSLAGGDAAESGVVYDNQQVWMETTLTGPGDLGFYWRVDSEDWSDTLSLEIDGVTQPGAISSFVDWAPRVVGIPPGTHVVRWTYAKDGSVSSGADKGWVDQVQFPSAMRVGIPEAVDAPGMSWTTGGDASWDGFLNASAVSGGDAARTGDLDDDVGGVSWLDTTVTGPGTLSFSWKMDDPWWVKEMSFLIDGVVQGGERYGPTPWTGESFTIPPGVHTFRWNYLSYCCNVGEANAWVDDVVFTPGGCFPGVGVTLTQTPPPGSAVLPGGAVTYRIVVANTGTETLTGLDVTDTVPPELAVAVTDQPPAFTPPVVVQSAGAGTRYEWSGSGLTMAPGAAYTFTLTGVVQAAGCTPVGIVNRVSVSASTACSSTSADSGMVTIAANPPPVALVVAKTQVPPSGATLAPGSPVAWRIVVTNAGSATLSGVTITDTVSAVFTGGLPEQPAAFAAPVVTEIPLTGTRYAWSATGLTMPPGSAYTFTLTGTVGFACGGAYGSAAFATASTACRTAVAATSAPSFAVPAPLLALSVTVTQSVPPGALIALGAPVTYRIVATNTGAVTVSSLTVLATVAAQITGVVVAQPLELGAPLIAGFGPGGTRYVWDAAGLALAPGASYTLTITGFAGEVCVAMTVTGRAEATGGGVCGFTTTASGTVSYVRAPPLLVLTAEATLGPAAPAAGDPVTYRVVVTNAGTATLATVTLAVTLPPVLTGMLAFQPPPFATPVVTSLAPSGTRFVWSSSGLSLGPGLALTFTITGTVSAAGTLSATAMAGGGGACGGAPPVGAASTLVASPALASGMLVARASLSPSGAVLVAGQTVTLALSVSNVGAGPVNGLVARLIIRTGVGASVTAGPVPAAPLGLAPWSATTFLWTLIAGPAGTLSLSASVAGLNLDATTAFAESEVVTPVVAPDSLLRASLAATPPAVKALTTFSVVLTVSNTGAVDVTGAVPALTLADASLGTILASPAAQDVRAGQSATFTWTLRAERAGRLGLTGAVSGMANGVRADASAAAEEAIGPNFAEAIVAYPNPVTGGTTLKVALQLEGDAEEIEVGVHDLGMRRVAFGVARNVTAVEGQVEVEEVRRLPPGVYLVKVRAHLAGGKQQTFPVVKLVVKP